MPLTGERYARCWLSCVVEPGDLRLARLLESHDPVEVARAVRAGQPLADRPTPDPWTARLAVADESMRGIAETAAAHRLRYVVPGDDEWPVELDDLDASEPLNGTGGRPLGIWVRGPGRLDDVGRLGVAVVGSRSASSYGVEVARTIVHDLVVHHDRTVVSGGAYGIDHAAHRAALEVGGTTVAVLACGADQAYPRANATTIERIAATGLVVSEHPPGATPTRARFLARNRLIAALSRGTVVVEAARRSGALNTLNWAGRLGRGALGVPGPVTSEASVGVHEALRGGAVLVTRALEVVEALSEVGSVDSTLARAAPSGIDLLSVPARAVFEQVSAARAESVESIARRVPCTPAEAALVLRSLVPGGFVEREGDLWRAVPIRRDAPAPPP